MKKRLSIVACATICDLASAFDYVQTNTESPLSFDASGGFDSAHIWGPLRGRMVYGGLKMIF
jgi:hypothetical protein